MTKELKYGLFIGSGIALVAGLIFWKGKAIEQYVENAVWDLYSEGKIKTLHPLVQNKAREFINKADKAGIKLRVTDGFRTYDQQNKEYAQGRTEAGNIVTNAKAGESSHNFGTAIDVVPIVNGKADYKNANWEKIEKIGESVGFEAGGHWKKFIDKPHFQMNFGKSIPQLRVAYEAGKTKGGYVDFNKIV
jgi:peptidoglycan L-alanyl-D-glutamate endopeptidase CwlK